MSSSTAPAPSPAEPTVKVADNPTLGKILVDAQGRTLYRYTPDTNGVSNCGAAGGCISLWPALQATNAPVGGSGVTGTLGTITRSDGTKQVAINGMALYTFAGDSGPGQTTGQGYDHNWYAVTPAGDLAGTAAAAPAASAATPPPAAGGGGYYGY